MPDLAIDWCGQGNWYSPGLMGMSVGVIDLDVAASGLIQSSLILSPYSVLEAGVSLNATVGSVGVGEPSIGALSCEDCEALSICLDVKSGGFAASVLSVSPYVPNDLTIALHGLSVFTIDASVVLHPVCCDWQNSPIVSHDSRAKANCYVEAITSGQVTFMIGDVQLDRCCPCGPAPIWRSGVAWYGVVKSHLCIDGGRSIYWASASQQAGSGVDVSPYSVGLGMAHASASVSLTMDAYDVSWGGVSVTSAVSAGVQGLLVDEAIGLNVAKYQGRSYQAASQVERVDGDVLVEFVGIDDVIGVSAGNREVVHTRRHALVSNCAVGDVFVIEASCESGKLIQIKVIVV